MHICSCHTAYIYIYCGHVVYTCSKVRDSKVRELFLPLTLLAGPSLPEVTPDPVQRETRLRKLQELTTYLETLHRLKECKKIQESARFVDIPSQVCPWAALLMLWE